MAKKEKPKTAEELARDTSATILKNLKVPGKKFPPYTIWYGTVTQGNSKNTGNAN
jgi:hypothetical protein